MIKTAADSAKGADVATSADSLDLEDAEWRKRLSQGHIFDDGQEPTGLRYSTAAALRFIPNIG